MQLSPSLVIVSLVQLVLRQRPLCTEFFVVCSHNTVGAVRLYPSLTTWKWPRRRVRLQNADNDHIISPRQTDRHTHTYTRLSLGECSLSVSLSVHQRLCRISYRTKSLSCDGQIRTASERSRADLQAHDCVRQNNAAADYVISITSSFCCILILMSIHTSIRIYHRRIRFPGHQPDRGVWNYCHLPRLPKCFCLLRFKNVFKSYILSIVTQ